MNTPRLNLDPSEPRPPKPRRLDQARRDLRRIAQDGVFFGCMGGLGETYVAAFALALGAGPVPPGFLATAPLLAGACLQLISPFGARRLGNLRRWVVLCATLQAATLVPLGLGALRGQLPLFVLFVSMALYWAAGMGANPAWNTWVGTLVPRSVRHHYFARRTVFHQLAILLAIVSGGFLLQLGATRGVPLRWFNVLFGCAILARAISARLLERAAAAGAGPRGALSRKGMAHWRKRPLAQGDAGRGSRRGAGAGRRCRGRIGLW